MANWRKIQTVYRHTLQAPVSSSETLLSTSSLRLRQASATSRDWRRSRVAAALVESAMTVHNLYDVKD